MRERLGFGLVPKVIVSRNSPALVTRRIESAYVLLYLLEERLVIKVKPEAKFRDQTVSIGFDKDDGVSFYDRGQI